MDSALTVPVLTILCISVTGLVALGFPLGLFLFANRKWRAPGMPLLIGSAVFIVFALVLEGFCHRLILGGAAGPVLRQSPWLYTLYGGLMAGLFEETGRLLAFRLVRKRYNSLPAALSYGIGHGGCEAVVLVGFAMLNNLVIALLLNTAGYEGMMRLMQIPESAYPAMEAAATSLATMPSAAFLAGGAERIIAVLFHVAASVLVWLAASGRGPKALYPLAITLHALVNIPAGLYQSGMIPNIWITEIITAVLVLAVCYLVYAVAARILRQSPSESTHSV